MVKLSEYICIFVAYKACLRNVLSRTLRILKETLSSFRDSDKTANILSGTPVEQKSMRSYLHIKVRASCHTVGCLGSWRYLSSHRCKKFPCLFRVCLPNAVITNISNNV